MNDSLFKSSFEEFIYVRTYSRWLDKLKRRENWTETVNRYQEFMEKRVPEAYKEQFAEAIQSIVDFNVMPSMRSLWTAGKALERENTSGFNCAYTAVDDIAVFSEILYILMCGTGVGFSVERQCINKLPMIPSNFTESDETIVFADSKLGWAEGYAKYIRELYKGNIFKYDTSKIRPKGARLKTFGGRACLTGDTVVYKEHNQMTIKDLFDVQNDHGLGKMKLRSLNEKDGTFYENELLNVIDNGVCPVFEVITKNGYKIKATDNHRFYNENNTWAELSEFKLGDKIGVESNTKKEFDEIIAIWYINDIRVFDLEMKAPDHNFIANGFISHNSGPEPLVALMDFTEKTFLKSKGRKLNSIECHDLICYIASIVVVGGSRRCLPLTSKITTDKGIKMISDVSVGDFVETGGQKYKILDKENTGEKQILKIKHDFGEIRCTPEHRVAVFTENDYSKYIFKHAKDITENDFLVWDSCGFEGNHTFLPTIYQDIPLKDELIKTPHLDTNVAWLLGIIHEDGCVGERTIEITTHRMEVLEKAKKAFDLFGVDTIDSKISKVCGNYYNLKIESKPLVEWFSKHIKQLKIPDFIMNGKRNVRCAYLAGLFDADSVTKIGYDQIYTVYSTLCEDVKQLLIGVGIGHITKEDQQGYTVSIAGRINKKAWLLHVGIFCVGEEKGMGDDVMSDVIYYPSKITLIAKDGIESTCDIEVENIKQFTTNGIVVHNSATISLSNLSDNRMAHAKDGNFYVLNPQRALANNSVAYTEKPDCIDFMEEWITLIRSHSGERGLFNRESVKLHLKKHVSRRNPNFDFGINPCVPFSTLILTDQGYKKIGETIDQEINIWNGKVFSKVKPFHSGNKNLYEVKLSDGSKLECTGNHKWVLWEGYSQSGKEYRKETTDLKVGEKLAKFEMPVIDEGEEYSIDAYSQGFGESHDKIRVNAFTPVNGTKQYCLEWFAGYVDVDEYSSYDKTYGLQITSINHQQLLDIKVMLTRLGCNPTVKKCFGAYRLCLDAQDLYTLYKNGLKTYRLQLNIEKPQRDARRFITIESITNLNKCEEVYCFNEPLNHTGTFNGIVTGQCGEIMLRNAQKCNLSEVIVRVDDTFEDLLKKVEHATIIGCVQATMTKFRFLRKQWTDNAEEERLLGVSLTGLRDHPILNHVHNTAKFWLEEMKKHAVETSRIWANRLGINEPTAVTTVKPSGTVSLLNNTSSGLHTRFSKYYIRRVRVSRVDPLCKMLKSQGFQWKPENGETLENYQTAVFGFPIKSPENAICNDNVDALEMLNYWKMLKTHWTEHSPSCTIFVKDSEWFSVGDWVYNNWNKVSGLAFLPADSGDYDQAPYEKITVDEYEEMVKITPEIDFSELSKFEIVDNTEGSQELACTGGSCEIV